ncbi:MAG: hypothetical protein SFX74_07955 [Fimbriimonadaceae bacterium]|nr:hypothetical protein [Fimbriimonadaceae bacterium]
MDDIQRADLQAWIRAAMDPMLLFVTLFIAVVGAAVVSATSGVSSLLVLLVAIMGHLLAAYQNSTSQRFRSPQFRSLWSGCRDRLNRFDEAIRRMNAAEAGQLDDMPQRIRAIGQSLYIALRRADLIAHEIQQSEDGITQGISVRGIAANDVQSMELYQIADRNAAEYRQQIAAIMTNVQRTEAQAVVFMTAVDTLRMKMVGYRLQSRNPAMPNQDLIAALTEARMQFESIDHALDELGLPTLTATK